MLSQSSLIGRNLRGFVFFLSFVFCCHLGFDVAKASEPSRYIDVVSVKFTDGSSSKQKINDIRANLSGISLPYWNSFLAKSKSFSFLEIGKVLDVVLPSTPPRDCNSESVLSKIRDVRSLVYGDSVDAGSRSRYLVILLPKINCLWEAVSTLNAIGDWTGGMLLNDTSSAVVLTHEIGHGLGLGHSNLLRCSTGDSDGPWGNNCKAIEYGGSLDVMGNVETRGLLSIYHQWRLGLIANEQLRISWTNETIDLNELGSATGVTGIFFRDKEAAYWLEYRSANLKDGYESGLVIYRADPPLYQFVESPLQNQSNVGRPGMGVSADIWMLNLGNYSYSQTGIASGSMTLTGANTFSNYSGNVKIRVISSTDNSKVKVEITRKADVTPPPTPILSDQSKWLSPEDAVLEQGFEDQETEIGTFEAEIDGKVVKEVSTKNDGTVATYLDPLIQRKILRVRDLPEGNYEIRIRSKDMWGNTSQWSTSRKILIDRSGPRVGNALNIISFDRQKIRLLLSDVKDTGSGLCRSAVLSDVGFVKQLDEARDNPTLEMGLNTRISNDIEIFDCLGNGLQGRIDISNQYISAEVSKKTGRWSPVKSGDLVGLRCAGKCTISTTVKNNVAVIFGIGKAEVLLTGKFASRIVESKSTLPRIGSNIAIGTSTKILRVTGQDFVIYGFVQSRLEFSTTEPATRSGSINDPSLKESHQKSLSKFGFRDGDFSNLWTISPMERGTTLLDPSLDLCSASYKSESERQYRRQVIATRLKSPYLFLSSEVVKYQDTNAGLAALKELQTNFEACVKYGGGVEISGTFVDYSFRTLPSSSAKLVSENSRVIVRAQVGKGAAARQLLAFYQFNGEMFTGLYVVKAGESGFADSEVINWFDVAGILGQRLDTKF